MPTPVAEITSGVTSIEVKNLVDKVSTATERVTTQNRKLQTEKKERGTVREETVQEAVTAANILLVETRDIFPQLPAETQKKVTEQLRFTLTILFVLNIGSHFETDEQAQLPSTQFDVLIISQLNTFLATLQESKAQISGTDRTVVAQRIEVLGKTIENQLSLALDLGQAIQLAQGVMRTEQATGQKDDNLPVSSEETATAKATGEERPAQEEKQEVKRQVVIEKTQQYFSGSELRMAINDVYSMDFSEFTSAMQRAASQAKNSFPVVVHLQRFEEQGIPADFVLDKTTYDKLLTLSWTKDAREFSPVDGTIVKINGTEVRWVEVVSSINAAENTQEVVQLRAKIVNKTPERFLIVRLSPQMVRQLLLAYSMMLGDKLMAATDRMVAAPVVVPAAGHPVAESATQPTMARTAEAATATAAATNRVVAPLTPRNEAAALPTATDKTAGTPVAAHTDAPVNAAATRVVEAPPAKVERTEIPQFVVTLIAFLSDGQTVRLNNDPKYDIPANDLDRVDWVRQSSDGKTLYVKADGIGVPPAELLLCVTPTIWTNFKNEAYRRSLERREQKETPPAHLKIRQVEVPWKNNPKRVALITETGRPIPFLPEELMGCVFKATAGDAGRGIVELIPTAQNQFSQKAIIEITRHDWEQIEAIIPQPLIVDKKVRHDDTYVYLNDIPFRKARFAEAERDPFVQNKVVVVVRSDRNPRPFRIEISQRDWMQIVYPFNQQQPTHGERPPERPETFKGVGAFSMRGKRPYMEDAVLTVEKVLAQKDMLIGIFDGHGGSIVAELAQTRLPDVVRTVNGRVQEPRALLQQSLLQLNAEIKADPRLNNMGATAAVVYVRDGFVYSANLGDARTVISTKKNAPIRLSKDHKADDPAEIQRIEQAGGHVTPAIAGVDVARVNGSLAVARALGDHSMNGLVSGEAYVAAHKVESDNQVVVTACDGIWDVISDEDAVRIVMEVKNKKGNEQAAARALVEAAYNRGSSDNLSAAVVYLR